MKLSTILTAAAGLLLGVVISVAVFLLVSRPIDANQDHLHNGDSIVSEGFKRNGSTRTEDQVRANVAGNRFEEVRTLADTLAFKHDFDQTVALYSLLAHADEVEVLKLIQDAQSITPPSQKDAALSIIFSRYASLSPSRALKTAKSLGEIQYSRLLRSIFHEWSRNDLDSALEAAESLSENQRRAAGYFVLTSRDDLEPHRRMEIATKFNLQQDLAAMNRQEWLRERIEDPRTAWLETFQSGDQDLRSPQVRRTIVQAWITNEGEGALPEIFAALPENDEKSSIIRDLLPLFVRTNPEATLGLISALPMDRDRRQLLNDVFRSWGEFDPESAFWALQSVGSRDHRRLYDRFFNVWANRNPHELLAEADKMPREFEHEAQAWAIRSLATSSPHEATTLLEDRPELLQRNDIVEGVARNWAESDPRSALEWFLNVEVEDGTARRSGLWTLTMRLTEQDPDLALSMALQTPGKLGDTMVSGVFNALAYADPKSALRYVPRLNNDEHRKIAMRNIGSESASKDIREAIELSGRLDESLREPFVNAVVDYAMRSHGRRSVLIEVFDAVPVPELKKDAAWKLLSDNEQWGFLSNEERRKLYLALDPEERREYDERVKKSLESVRTGPSRTP